MTSHPPHLPPKSISVTLHNLFSHTRNFVVFVGISVLAGITGALVVTAWIEPTFYDVGNTFVLRGNQSLVSSELPDVFVLQRYQQSTLSLFSAQAEVEDGWYADDGFVGTLVMLTSDGWGVSYLPTFTDQEKRALQPLDANGLSYDIEKVIHDPIYDITYIKLDGNNFHVLPFASWNDIDVGTHVWSVHNNDWEYRTVMNPTPVVSGAYAMTDVYERFTLDPDINKKGIIISSQGQFIGFVDNNNLMHSADSVSYQIASLLTQGQLQLPEITSSGYFVRYIPEEASQTDKGYVVGFFVVNPRNVSALQQGDILIEVNDKVVTRENLHQLMYRSTDTTTLTVWRSGEEFDILVSEE